MFLDPRLPQKADIENADKRHKRISTVSFTARLVCGLAVALVAGMWFTDVLLHARGIGLARADQVRAQQTHIVRR